MSGRVDDDPESPAPPGEEHAATPASPADGALAPGLYLVSTPIGNLEDITLRALRVLKHCAVIACEDTRHSRRLLDHFGIRTKTVSYHQHNEVSRAGELLQRLQSGAAVAVISDAGTPGIRDPGAELVRAAVAAGVQVFAVPGASALLAALVPSGLSADDFRFCGFLPARAGERRTMLEALRTEPATLVFYETPHRLAESLGNVQDVLGSHRRAVLARELTKLHEEFVRGTIAEVRAEVRARDSIRGEMVLLVEGFVAGVIQQPQAAAEETLREAMQRLLAEGLSEKDALKRAARERSSGRDELYREWQRIKPRR